MTHAIYDFAAIRKETKAFPEDRPQNVVKPAEGDKVTEHLIFDPYADGAFPADYSCWAATLNDGTVLRTLGGRYWPAKLGD